jgi:DNA-binding CsgD family transcriptional regulator
VRVALPPLPLGEAGRRPGEGAARNERGLPHGSREQLRSTLTPALSQREREIWHEALSQREREIWHEALSQREREIERIGGQSAFAFAEHRRLVFRRTRWFGAGTAAPARTNR